MKTILITGASKGIGFQLVKTLAKQNNIIAISRDVTTLKGLNNVIPMQFDITDFEHYAHLIAQINSPVDHVIHNAGLLINKKFETTKLKDLEQQFATNYYAPYLLTQSLLPLLLPQSHILMISSMGGVQGSSKFSGLSAYSGSKAGLINLAECLAEELKGRQIRVNAIALGAVQTEMLSQAFPDYKTEIKPETICDFIANILLNTEGVMNGKTIQLAVSTP